MPIRDFPLSTIRPGSIPKPYLPVIVANPANNKQIRLLGLIDTGADECALPASFASLLGHNLQAGQQKTVSTGNGDTVAYSHTTRLTIQGFVTNDVLVDFMPNLYVPLLGVRNFLSNFVFTIDYPNNTFSLRLP